MSLPYRLRRALANALSRNVFCSEAAARDVYDPAATPIVTAPISTDITGQSMPILLQAQHPDQNSNTCLNHLPYTATSLRVALHCEGCKHKVADALSKIKGVEKIEISMKNQKVIVYGHVDPQKVFKVIQKTGKFVEILPYDDEAAKKETQVKFQLAALSYLRQTHGMMEECPVEPIAELHSTTPTTTPSDKQCEAKLHACTDDVQRPGGVYGKVRLKRFSSVDAKYVDPNSEQASRAKNVPSMASKWVKPLSSYSKVEIKQELETAAKLEGQHPPGPVNVKLQASRSTSYNREPDLADLRGVPTHLKSNRPRMAHKNADLYENMHSRTVPMVAERVYGVRKPTGASGYAHEPFRHIHRSEPADHDHEEMESSDDDPEELQFAVVKTKKGLKLVPIESSPLLRNPQRNYNPPAAYSDPHPRSKYHRAEFLTPQATMQAKSSSIPCSRCCRINSSRAAADAGLIYNCSSDAAARSRQSVPRAGRVRMSSDLLAHRRDSSHSPDYQTADQYTGEDELEEEEEQEDEEGSSLHRRSYLHFKTRT